MEYSLDNPQSEIETTISFPTNRNNKIKPENIPHNKVMTTENSLVDISVAQPNMKMHFHVRNKKKKLSWDDPI